jgi:hypothetical protein
MKKKVYICYLSIKYVEINFCVTTITYIMYNVHHYSVLYNNIVRPVTMWGLASDSHVENIYMTASVHIEWSLEP